jgi:hypothetical protein
MLTDVQIINLGVSKLAATRISQIAPPRTPLEVFMANNYPQWKREVLTKHRWVCALEEQYVLTLVEKLTTDTPQPYKYQMPVDCLRPLRSKRTEWKQRGRHIYSAYATLSLDYIRNIPNSEFDPLLNEVLSCKVAYESAEYITQSNAKKQSAEAMYERAITDAYKANAFVVGPEDIASDDEDYGWVSVRY